MSYITLIGYAAATFSMVSFAPQAWKVIRSSDTQSISLVTYLVTVAGFSLWLTFGLLKAEWPLVVSNSVCLVLSGLILTMKLLPQKEKDAIRDTVTPH